MNILTYTIFAENSQVLNWSYFAMNTLFTLFRPAAGSGQNCSRCKQHGLWSQHTSGKDDKTNYASLYFVNKTAMFH